MCLSTIATKAQRSTSLPLHILVVFQGHASQLSAAKNTIDTHNEPFPMRLTGMFDRQDNSIIAHNRVHFQIDGVPDAVLTLDRLHITFESV
jgi:hypothetical protein